MLIKKVKLNTSLNGSEINWVKVKQFMGLSQLAFSKRESFFGALKLQAHSDVSISLPMAKLSLACLSRSQEQLPKLKEQCKEVSQLCWKPKDWSIH
mmetsp:Transcript_17103/g.22599  ORF Transcript_17103/g.22599 Transcript_17103/m.22599 type:complete len:96 (-) Transcript_17103:1188-1475(-)